MRCSILIQVCNFIGRKANRDNLCGLVVAGFPPPSAKGLHVITIFGFHYPFINLLFADRLSIDSLHNRNRITKRGSVARVKFGLGASAAKNLGH